MSTPRSAASETTTGGHSAFAGDVEYYLSLSPRQLPSLYLYDDLGSALFDAICRLPWYPITRTETQMLARHGRRILSRRTSVGTVVELGPGSGEKLATLLDAAGDSGPSTVHLVDISAAALDVARRTVALNRDVEVVAHQASYEAGLAAALRSARPPGALLTLLLGSNIGNFDKPGAHAFLRGIRAELEPGDLLLLGADLVKPEPELLAAYDDPLGVTAAFNRNLLVRANRELGANFDLAGFAHRAVWNAAESRVEMHLLSVRAQRVAVPAARLDIEFRRDETIWTESSYKYRPADLLAMLERAGFARADQWVDDEGGFALSLVEAR
jgi:dimethylhistidine N-methyltransferase